MNMNGGAANSFDQDEISVVKQESPRKRIKIDGAGSYVDSPSSCSTGSESPMSVKSPATPMPHTPLFSPSHANHSPSSSSAPFAHQELSQEQLKLGWRRFLSERELRVYYFNKFTQESRWEPPTVADNTRRRNGTTTQPQIEVYKKFVPSDEWNLNVATNAKMAERIPFDFFPPNQEIEILRAQNMSKLCQNLTDACQTKEGVDLPQDSFQRWLIERKMTDEGCEPCLPSKCSEDFSPSLSKDLMSVLPVRVEKVSTIPDARKLLSKYAEAAKKIVETRNNVSPENRKLVKWHCQSTFEWLRGSQFNAKFEEYVSRFRFLRGKCQSVLTDTIKPNVEFICSRIYNQSREYAANVLDEHRKLLQSNGVEISPHPLPPPKQNKIVSCYSVQLRYRWPRLPDVQMEQTCDDKWVKLTYKQETLKIGAAHFYKLEQLYKMNCFDDRKFEMYLARVWCMLKRYQCLLGVEQSQDEDVSLQQALPREVFECLVDDFAATFECFASPLNCYFRQYCSMYADTDGYFGSRGSFFNFEPSAGSFVVNPPHIESLMNNTIDRIERMLVENSAPMSFVVFLPEWKEPSTLAALNKVTRSRFNRGEITAPAYDHYFKNSWQHLIGSNTCSVKSSTPTVVVVLQNDAGFTTWTPNDRKMQRIVACFGGDVC